MLIFNWSLLPNEIKRIIFNYCKLDYSLKIKNELKNLVKYQKIKKLSYIIDELNYTSFNKQIRIYKLIHNTMISYEKRHWGNEYWDELLNEDIQVLGEYNDDTYILDNICYICKKNNNNICNHKIYFNWYNKIKKKKLKSNIYICDNCYNNYSIIIEKDKLNGNILMDCFN